MGIDKEDSKYGGRKVGGFLQLFDWTAKSRKKLFATKSDSPESSKQGKRYDGNLPMTRLHLVDEYESGTASMFKGSSDRSCASSIADDEGYGGHAPGVVARLMGLDSLPTSSFSEHYSTPNFDTQSIWDAQFQRKNVDYVRDRQIMNSVDLLHKVEGTTRIDESKSQKILNRPIEKFHSEVLPPKSAKTIPVTHHKLLSPIKGPGFITSKNAACIMEAAAKIIEPRPQVTTKAKTPVLTASPMSLKVRELKEKMEASQKGRAIGSTSLNSRMRAMKEKVEASNKTARPIERQRMTGSNTVNYLKRQSLNKTWNGPEDTTFRVPADVEGSHGFKNEGKSISLAVQAKVNVQRREGLNSSCNRSLGGQKEQHEGKPITLIKNQPQVQKSLQRKASGHNSCGVLRQNNKKQNSLMDKDKPPSKTSISKAHGRKLLHGDSPYGRKKNSTKPASNMKCGSWKQAVEITDSEKEVLYSSADHFPRKKRSLGKDFQLGRGQSVSNMFEEKAKKPEPSYNTIINNSGNWLKDSKHNGSDVVSFTFTTPLVRTNSSSEISGTNVLSLDDRVKRVLLESESVKLSPMRYNIINGDALSTLLEQKLIELTNGVQPSHGDSFREGAILSTASNAEDRMPSHHLDSMLSRSRHYEYQNPDSSLTKFASEFSSVGHQDYKMTLTPQTIDWINLQKINQNEGQFPNCRYPSPISVLEPSISTESCCSSVSTETDYTAGSKLSSSVQAQEIGGSTFSKKLNSVYTDTELLDSASSISIKSGGESQVSSQSWELEYVKDILSNVEVMFIDFTVGKTRGIISPHVFYLLENRKSVQVDGAEYRLRRKLMFDCVCECLDLRLSLCAGAGYGTWTKGVATVRRKELLAEQVYKGISGWGGMGDLMVDELVDNDMSTHHGKWQHFDVDAFELGLDIGHQIFNSLIDEILADIL